MKIQQDHLNHLKAECLAVIAKYPNLIHEYESGDFPRADRVKNLQERFNHDVMFDAGLTKFVCDELYSYLHDDHIASALRSFMPKVTRNY